VSRPRGKEGRPRADAMPDPVSVGKCQNSLCAMVRVLPEIGVGNPLALTFACEMLILLDGGYEYLRILYHEGL